MENNPESLNEVFEVEKIITCKFCKNNKYYLIKWLSYPITESTWEPKSNIKHLKEILDKFEVNYPNSIDQNMYNIYCNEMKKRKITSKKKQKKKENKNGIVSLSKIKKIEGFTKAELKNICYEKLKSHFFIDVIKRNVEKAENQVIIELTSNSSSTSISEENISIIISEKEDIKEMEEKNDENKLNIPILE